MNLPILTQAAALRSQAQSLLSKAIELEEAVATYPHFFFDLDSGEWTATLIVQGCGVQWLIDGYGETAADAVADASTVVRRRAELCGLTLADDWTVLSVNAFGSIEGKPVRWIEPCTFAGDFSEEELERIESLGFHVSDLAPGVHQLSHDIASRDQPTRSSCN